MQGTHLATLQALIAKGVVPARCTTVWRFLPDQGGTEFKEWLGGHYEHQFSCNPMWEPHFTTFPTHPITQGVQPFQIKDEWYMNMRFRPAFGDGTKAASDGKTSFVPSCRRAVGCDARWTLRLPKRTLPTHSGRERPAGGHDVGCGA